jgi:hypothetical protein
MAGGDITVEILKDIRDEIRGMRTGLGEEIRGVRVEVHELRADTNKRLDATNQHLDLVETAILDLVEQHRFVVRYTRAMSERGTELEPRVSALETRVDKLESK